MPSLLTQHFELYAFTSVTHDCVSTILHIERTAVGSRVFLLEGLQPQGHIPRGDRMDKGYSRFTGHSPIDIGEHLVGTGHLAQPVSLLQNGLPHGLLM